MSHFVEEMRRTVLSEAKPQHAKVNDRFIYVVVCCEEKDPWKRSQSRHTLRKLPSLTMDLFGIGKTPAQRMKEYQRGIKKSVREMDRERTTLERNEKKLMTEIKKAAKDGHMDAAKIKAKDLVRTRNYIKKMHKMKGHLEAVSLRLTTMQSSQQMASSMKGITKIMARMNQKMNMPQIQKVCEARAATAGSVRKARGGARARSVCRRLRVGSAAASLSSSHSLARVGRSWPTSSSRTRSWG